MRRGVEEGLGEEGRHVAAIVPAGEITLHPGAGAVWAGGAAFGMRATKAVYNSSGLQYYRHADWLGSVRLVSTTGRTVSGDTAYAPFGYAYAQPGGLALSFTGQKQGTAANLYDFMYREYGIQGRWPSPDPLDTGAFNLADPQTLDLYAYVRNSPMSLTDPLGLLKTPGYEPAFQNPWGTWDPFTLLFGLPEFHSLPDATDGDGRVQFRGVQHKREPCNDRLGHGPGGREWQLR
jgi:RHS repeat-associated protein